MPLQPESPDTTEARATAAARADLTAAAVHLDRHAGGRPFKEGRTAAGVCIAIRTDPDRLADLKRFRVKRTDLFERAVDALRAMHTGGSDREVVEIMRTLLT